MRSNRQYVFNTSSREGLIDLSHRGAISLRPLLLKTQSLDPIIVSVDGFMDSGKSLVWDSIVEKILGDSAEKIYEFPNPHGRGHEIWSGKNQLGGKPDLKISVCNPDQLPSSGTAFVDFLKQYLAYETKKEASHFSTLKFGDVIIVSNRCPKFSDLHFELSRNQGGLREKWGRVVGVNARNVVGRSKEFKVNIIREAEYSVAL